MTDERINTLMVVALVLIFLFVAYFPASGIYELCVTHHLGPWLTWLAVIATLILGAGFLCVIFWLCLFGDQ